jgi:hypothetical protein
MNLDKLKAKIKRVKVDNELIIVKRQMNKLQNENKQDLNIKIWGWLFGFIGSLGFMASTIMSIVGGLKTYKSTLGILGFVIGIIFVQLVVYVFCIKESIIKNKFPRYYTVVKLVQIGLLSISINYNYQFFDKKTFWNFLLSILLEVGIILITTIGGDFRILNFKSKKVENGLSLLSIFAMWRNNKLHNLKVKIIREYNQNLNVLTQSENVLTIQENVLTPNEDISELGLVKSELSQEVKSELSQVKTKLSPIILLKEKDYEELRFEIETYLKENFKSNDIITTGKIRETFNLTESQWKKIKNDLNCIESVGTKLKYKEVTK